MGLLPFFFGPSLLLLSAIFFAFGSSNSNGLSYSNFSDNYNLIDSALHLPLHHRLSPHSPASSSTLPLTTIFTHDNTRVKILTSRLFKTTSARPTSLNHRYEAEPQSVSDPLTPGGSVGLGNYITHISIGTPAISYVMVVDTGSSLTWLQCHPCAVSCHAQVGTVFDPRRSATYQSVACTNSECTALRSATLNPSSCSKSNVCVYQASYGDSSFSLGYLSKDTLSLSHFSFPGFIYGCGQDNEGLFGKSAGIIGLARNKLSFLSQISPKVGRYSFSYCLPTEKSTGFLSIGSFSPTHLTYTPMVSSSLDDSLYFIKLSSISVSGKTISVSSSSYNSIPTIIDSGTVITRLESDLYTALSAAFVKAMTLKGFKKTEGYSILDTCFKGRVDSIKVPDVVLGFERGAMMKLRGDNVMIEVEEGELTCLAFAPATRVSIIGNRQQEGFRVVYDVAGKRIGFATSGCR